MNIRIGLFGYFFDFLGFRIIRLDSVNNTSGSVIFCNTVQDPLRYFLHFGLGTDRVFWFGFRVTDFMPSPIYCIGFC